MIVKSCKNGGCSTAILTLLSPAGTPCGVAPITQLATNAKCNLLNVDFYGAARVVLRFAEHNHVTVLPLPNGR